MPTPKSVPGRRDALDLPGLPARAGAGSASPGVPPLPACEGGWAPEQSPALGRKTWAVDAV